MAQTFIVGRQGTQSFKITSDGVSAQHAKITQQDSGEWYVEDLNGDEGNGTFIKDENGDFVRIYSKKVDENTVVRLGKGGYHSYLFTIHHLLAQPDDYEYEFKLLRERQRSLSDELEKIRKKDKIMTTAGNIVVQLSVGLLAALVTKKMAVGFIILAVARVIFNYIFKPDKKKLMNVQQKMGKLITCPRCGKPLSKHELDSRLCLACHAKG
jgi:hypothetical protein